MDATKSLGADICGEKNGRLGGRHDCSECQSQRDNRQRSVGKVFGCDFRRSELSPFRSGLGGWSEWPLRK
jgi:hypothetical protein